MPAPAEMPTSGGFGREIPLAPSRGFERFAPVQQTQGVIPVSVTPTMTLPAQGNDQMIKGQPAELGFGRFQASDWGAGGFGVATDSTAVAATVATTVPSIASNTGLAGADKIPPVAEPSTALSNPQSPAKQTENALAASEQSAGNGFREGSSGLIDWGDL
eukprot:gnl/MRDRNA2_/MRDRNA2_193472_c0_seq1.p1 gnl/MRDRNA2_/MRDRNA2_193472_c0~~gnl/MRDRNA2_/MRDRNA2_193472_c0_seq1.p1  ORF type:complete len:168 (+),score=33.24 gnl/MRDRNA2_/MRDRNA2_193472_c0_seq1:25-504(+)